MKDIELEIYNLLNEIKLNTKSVFSKEKNYIIKESSQITFEKKTPEILKKLNDLGIKDIKPLSPNQKNFIKEKNKIKGGPNEGVFEAILSCVDGTETVVPGSSVQEAAIELYDNKTIEAKFTQKTLNSFIQEEKAKQVSDVEGEVKPSKVLACLYYSEIETFKKAYNDYFKVGKPIPSLKDFYNQTNGQCLSYSLAQINSTPLGCTTAFYMDSGIFEATQGGNKGRQVMTIVALTYGSWFVYDNGYNSYINWKTKLDNYIEQQSNISSGSFSNKEPRTKEEAERQSKEKMQNVDRGLGQIKMVQNKDGDNATFSFQYFEASDDEKKRVFMNEFMSKNIIPELLTPWDAISNRNYVGSYKEKIHKVDLADFSTVEQIGNVQNTRLPSGDLKMDQTSAVNFTKLQPFTDDELSKVENSKVSEDGSVIRIVNGSKEVVTDPYCLKKGQPYVNLRTSSEVDLDFSERTFLDPSGGGNFIKWTGQQVIGNWTGTYILKYLPIFKTMVSQDVYGDKRIYVTRITDGDSRKNFFSEIDSLNLVTAGGSFSRSVNRAGKETGYYNGDCLGSSGFDLYCNGQFDKIADLSIAANTNLVEHEYHGPAAKYGFKNGEKLNNKQIWDIAIRTGVAKYWLEIEIPKDELQSSLARMALSGEMGVIDKYCDGGDICKVWVAAKYVEPCRTGSKQETRNFADFTGEVELKNALNYNLDDEGRLVIYRQKYIEDEIKNWNNWCKNQKNNKFTNIYDCSKKENGDQDKLNQAWGKVCSSQKLSNDELKFVSDILQNKLKKFIGKKVRCMDDVSEHTNNSSEVFKSYPTLLFSVPTNNN